MNMLGLRQGTVIPPMLEATPACVEHLKQVMPAALDLERTCASVAVDPRVS